MGSLLGPGRLKRLIDTPFIGGSASWSLWPPRGTCCFAPNICSSKPRQPNCSLEAPIALATAPGPPRSKQGMAWPGGARFGEAWPGEAWPGAARPGMARQGKARQGRDFFINYGRARHPPRSSLLRARCRFRCRRARRRGGKLRQLARSRQCRTSRTGSAPSSIARRSG